MDYAGTSEPQGWLSCDGRSLNKNQYQARFAAIGYTWGGTGDNFNIPNLNHRTTIGYGTQNVGAYGGATTHTLTTNEMPSHAHGGTTGSAVVPSASVGGCIGAGGGGGAACYAWDTNPVHSHTIPADGGGVAHNNMQPYAVILKIIKYC